MKFIKQLNQNIKNLSFIRIFQSRIRMVKIGLDCGGLLMPRLHGSGQIFARTKTCTVRLAFTWDRRNWSNI